MIELLYFLVFILVSFSIGRRLLKLFKLKISFIEEITFGICLGYFVLGYITFFLGIFGLLYKPTFYVIFLLGIFISFFDMRYILQNIKKGYSNFNFGLNLESLLLGILLFFIMINLVAVIGPVWHWDTTSYHFAVPKLYIKEHSIFYIFHSIGPNMPFFSQMLYLTAIILENAILAKLIAYSFSIILVLAIITFSNRFFNVKVGLFGALIFFLMPIFMQSSVGVGSDIPVALFCFMALYAFVVWFKGLDIRWLILSAIMMGVALSTKYFAGIQFLILFSFLAFKLITVKNKRLQYKLMCLFLFSIIPLLIFSPWLIKNYVYTGNPVFPLIYSVFGGRYLIKANVINMASAGNSLPVDLKNYILLPWYLTMFPSKFPSIMGIGPIFLAFIPLLLILKNKRNSLIKLLLIFGFLGITFWFFIGGHYLRFIYFVFPPLAIVCAFVIDQLVSYNTGKANAFPDSQAKPEASKILRVFVLAMLLSTPVFNLNLWAGMNLKYFPVVFGFETEEQFYDKLKDYNLYDASKFINANTPYNAKVLLFQDNRGFFIDRDYIFHNNVQTTYFDDFYNETALLGKLNELNITHILVNRNFDYNTTVNNPHLDEIYESFTNITTKYSRKIYSRKGIEVFELEWKS